MKKLFMFFMALIALSANLHAQTSPDTTSSLVQWIQSQQANAGLGLDWKGNKYVTTSWDLLSIGQSGLNVAKAGSSDFFDFGPLMSVANAEKARYGALPLFHGGNIWNAIGAHLPSGITNHIRTTSLPDIAAGIGFFEPKDGVLNHWHWRNDTQLVVVWRFGGN
jgi:high-affinity Fe2+/Pb2+ permease